MKHWFSFVLGAFGFVALGCGSEDPADVDQPPPDVAPTIELTTIGTPSWQIVDHHQFSVRLPALDDYTEFIQTAKDLLPPPNHGWQDPPVGIVPGDAHPPPYDGEFAAGVTALGLDEHTVFAMANVTVPNTFVSVFMVAAKSDGPQGSSPDFATGPIIPDTLFPIRFDSTKAINGVINPAGNGGFDVLPMSMLRPDLTVDGHSHFPMFRSALPKEDSPGEYVLDDTLTDTAGNGWKIKQRFVVW